MALPQPYPLNASLDAGGSSVVLPLRLPVLVEGGLLDVNTATGETRVWESHADRDGHLFSFPCASSSAAMGVEHQVVSMDRFYVDYVASTGLYQALHCPALSTREGIPNPSCRKLGAGLLDRDRELTFLGLGRVMLWRRRTLEYSVWSAAERRDCALNQLRCDYSDNTPFFVPVRSGSLAGVHNQSRLLHLAVRGVNVVLEVVPDGTYRLWNSEGWARGARGSYSPLAGPVGRGHFPRSDPDVVWTSAPTQPVLLSLAAKTGAYRALRVDSVDLDSLRPATTRQPPLMLQLLNEGPLDVPTACEGATERAACARLGGPCGWCERTDGVRPSSCLPGGPARPCAAECSSWSFFDPRDAPPPPPPSPPPPSPPGLSDADLVRLEAHSARAGAEAATQPPPVRLIEAPPDALPRRRAAEPRPDVASQDELGDVESAAHRSLWGLVKSWRHRTLAP